MHNEDTPWWSLPNLLVRLVYRLRLLIPRQPVVTESPAGFLKRTIAEQDALYAERMAVTRERLKHEFGFDDDH